MTITFENDNDVIVYAFEKVIAYARRTHQIFVAQCVWWLASTIGLEQGLIILIDYIQSREEVAAVAEALSKDKPCAKEDRDTAMLRVLREVSTTPRDIQEDPRRPATLDNVHPDRRAQIQASDEDISSPDIDDSRLENLRKDTAKFILLSRRELKAATKRHSNTLPGIRSGKVVKPITKKQRKYLQSIPKGTIAEYLDKRK
jgi:hypothetical protein